jgi:hypothetical protein
VTTPRFRSLRARLTQKQPLHTPIQGIINAHQRDEEEPNRKQHLHGEGKAPAVFRPGEFIHWVKVKTPKAPAVKREVGEEWGTKPFCCIVTTILLSADSRHRGPLKNSIAANIAKLPEFLPIHVDR